MEPPCPHNTDPHNTDTPHTGDHHTSSDHHTNDHPHPPDARDRPRTNQRTRTPSGNPQPTDHPRPGAGITAFHHRDDDPASAATSAHPDEHNRVNAHGCCGVIHDEQRGIPSSVRARP